VSILIKFTSLHFATVEKGTSGFLGTNQPCLMIMVVPDQDLLLFSWELLYYMMTSKYVKKAKENG